MRKGISFAEVLVTLVVIGLLSTLTIPVIKKTLSSQHKQLYKAAVENVNAVVIELINDAKLYPAAEFTTGTKFCTDFAGKVKKTTAAVDCTNAPSIPSTPNFVTVNGMKWYFIDTSTGLFSDFIGTCPDGAGSNCLLIYVDVNGNRGKNSFNATDAEQRDILKIYLSKTGKLYIPPTLEGPERSYMTN